MEFKKECYFNKEKGITEFIPEKEIKLIKLSNRGMMRYFPYREGTDYSKLKITNIGLYSVVQRFTAEKILETIVSYFKKDYKNLIITDANGGVGGVPIYLSSHFKEIKAVEVIKKHHDVIKSNLKVYGITNVKVYHSDYLKIMMRLKQDVIFFDPPWGGEGYSDEKSIPLGLNNVNIACIINKLFQERKAKMIILFVPKNFDFQNFKKLIGLRFFTVQLRKGKRLLVFT